MTLTHDDLNVLKAVFPVKDHEFLNGNAYLTESAITERIESVDPEWRFERLDITARGAAIVAAYRLTIKGISRDNVGMAQVMTNSGGRETNEAEKSAVTDALKRCARLFGIGRYLLDLPSWVEDGATLTKHLSGSAPAGTPPSPAPAAPKADGKAATVTHLDDESIELVAALVETKAYTDKKSGEEKKRLVYHCANDVKATAFSTRAAKASGYDVSTWGEVGMHDIMPPAVVTVKRKGDFWDAVDVRPSQALGKTGTDDVDFLA